MTFQQIVVVPNTIKQQRCNTPRRCSFEKLSIIISIIDMLRSIWWSASAIIFLVYAHHMKFSWDNHEGNDGSTVKLIITTVNNYFWDLSVLKSGAIPLPSATFLITAIMSFFFLQLVYFACGNFLCRAITSGCVTKLTRWLVISILIYFGEALSLSFFAYFVGMPTLTFFIYLIFKFTYETCALILVRTLRDQVMQQDSVSLLRCNYYYLHGIL